MQTPDASARPGAPADLARRPAPASMSVIGTIVSGVGLIAWFAWLSWRTTSFQGNIVSIAILALDLVAFAASLVVCAGLAVSRPLRRRDRRATDSDRQLPVLLAEGLDLGAVIDEKPGVRRIGNDDTGEIAWARRGISVLRQQRRLDTRTRLASDNLRQAAWSVVALDGLRRSCVDRQLVQLWRASPTRCSSDVVDGIDWGWPWRRHLPLGVANPMGDDDGHARCPQHRCCLARHERSMDAWIAADGT